eukprot:13422046-Ditylum_brightwellii.AAC.1
MDGSQCKYCKYHGHWRYSTEECNIIMTCNKGHTCHECEEESHNNKKVCFQSDKIKWCGFSSDDKNDLNTIIDAKIAKAMLKTVTASPMLAAPPRKYWTLSETPPMGRPGELARKKVKRKS